MIDSFVRIWDEFKDEIRIKFSEKKVGHYGEVVDAVIAMLHEHSSDYDKPDPGRITEINHGDYQGTLLYVIAGSGYQPSNYWSVYVSYGSCSGCDTLDAINEDGNYDSEKPSESQVDQYMTLALHILQSLKEI